MFPHGSSCFRTFPHLTSKETADFRLGVGFFRGVDGDGMIFPQVGQARFDVRRGKVLDHAKLANLEDPPHVGKTQ